MWEKYDVRYDDGRPGQGGEYKVQEGFGWTNGAVLDLMLIYADVVKAPPSTLSSHSAKNSAATADFLKNDSPASGTSWHTVVVVTSIIICFLVLFW